MTYKQYDDIKIFYRDTYDIMMRHEAQNLVPLGNVIIGNEGKDKTGWRNTENWFLATVSDHDDIKLTAIMTPPFNLTLYATDNQYSNETITSLIDGIIDADIPVSGVMTVSDLAESFARGYCSAKGVTYEIKKHQRIYELTQINPDIDICGNLRLARGSDMSFLPYWFEGFDSDCFGSTPAVQHEAGPYEYHVSTGKLYVLEDNGTPVTMAKINKEMQTVCGVGYVYTPPYFRKKGYATSCVAMLSRIILERGYSKCALYTDLANPISNSIYQKIGYKPLCDSLEIKFI